MTLFLLSCLLAGAAEPSAHYDPGAIAAASSTFATAADAAAPRFEQAQRNAGAIADALNAWEEALDILGSLTPGNERDALDEVRHTFFRDKAVVQRFAQQQADDFEAAFQGALTRALAGRVAEACEAAQGGLRMGPARSSEPKTCPGADLSAELAATIDKDPTLRAALEEISARPWPEISVNRASGARIPAGSSKVIDASTFFRAHIGHALTAIAVADEDARTPLAAAVESDSVDAQRQLTDEARLIDKRTAGQRHDLASAFLDHWYLAREKGRADFGWCARPAVLGGCGVEPAGDPGTLIPATWLKLLDGNDAWRP